MRNDRKITTYRCVNKECRAEDHDKGFNDPAPVELNCYKCHNRGSMQIVSVDPAK